MKKILLVDDEVSLLEIFELMLVSKGHEVDSVSDINDAFNKLNNNYDFYFIDCFLENGNSLKLVNEIVKKSKPSNVCILSGLEDEKMKKKFKKLGVEKFLKKPILSMEFDEIIN